MDVYVYVTFLRVQDDEKNKKKKEKTRIRRFNIDNELRRLNHEVFSLFNVTK